MRVLWLTDNSSVGTDKLKNREVGSAWIVSLEAELTKIQGVELGVLFTCRQTDVEKFTVGTTQYFPVPVIHPKGKLRQVLARYRHDIDTEEIVEKYLEVIEEFKPDVIHIFGSEHNFGLIIPRISVPCIIHLQGNLTVNGIKWFSGLSAADVYKYSNKWLIARGHGLYHWYFVNRKAAERERRIFRECRYFMGRTDWDRRLAAVMSPGSEYFHCEEIMRPAFYNMTWPNPAGNESFTIVSTIRNNIYKGLETIVESKRILSQNFPGKKITWKIAGITENDEISAMVARKLNVSYSSLDIQLAGSLNEDQLIVNMQGANLFVHASHIENSSNSICEAMLMGMPVIATYAGGTPAAITDSKEGLLVQDGDPYALAGAILEIMNNNQYAVQLGKNARERALARNQPDKVVGEVVKIYSSVVSGK